MVVNEIPDSEIKEKGYPTERDRWAHYRYPGKSGCKNSSMAGGNHRIGMVSLVSVLDGGAPGDILVEECMDCGKRFEGHERFLVIPTQPRELKKAN